MNEDIKKIIEAGIQAPSGENCQPWKVKVSGDTISLFNDPEKDLSVYNFEQRGSLVACGAFIENSIIRANALGYDVAVQLYDGTNNNLVGELILKKNNILSTSELSRAIEERATNRKPYKHVIFSPDQKQKMINCGFDNIKVITLDDQSIIKKLSSPISLNEQLIFENKSIHDFFYNHVRWNEAEDKKEKNGFFIKTLELKLPQKIAFNLFKSWKWVIRGKKINISEKIAQDNAKNYATASILGIITLPQGNPTDFIKAGRVMERIWLSVTAMGLSLQPMTGVLFFKQRIDGNQAQDFSQEEILKINKAYQEIKDAFSTNDIITMLFRIGDGGKPSARSSRFNISEIVS